MSSETLPPDPAPEDLSPARFRSVAGHFASGVTVITTAQDGVPSGTTASAVTSLSDEPPMMLVCLNRTSATGQAVTETGRLAINVLGEGQAELAMRFATKDPDKFADVAWAAGALGQPLLTGAIAVLECEVTERVAGGTHTVFMAQVRGASASSGEAPLAYFRGQFGRLAPPVDAVAAPPKLGGLHEALRAQAAVELGVATLTVGRVPATRLAPLRTLGARLAPADEISTIAEWLAHYGDFHRELVGLTDSAELVDAHARLDVPAVIAATLETDDHDRSEVGRVARSFAEHVELLEAWEAGDLATCTRLLTEHVDRIAAAVGRAS